MLRKVNRTLLEMWTGMALFGTVCQLAGLFLAGDQARYAKSLWFGILLAAVNAFHMYRTLDRALGLDERTASKAIFKGYMFRYVFLVALFAVIMVTNCLNPLIVFLAYMSLKVTALMQPITHKFYNKVFHETDPVPMPLEENPPQEERTKIPREGEGPSQDGLQK